MYVSYFFLLKNTSTRYTQGRNLGSIEVTVIVVSVVCMCNLDNVVVVFNNNNNWTERLTASADQSRTYKNYVIKHS